MIACMSIGAWARSERRTVVFDVDIHCQGCIDKIEKNIAFERGVKDLECNLDEKTVQIVYDPAKTDIKHLQAAFAKINKNASVRYSEEQETQDNDRQQEQDKEKEVDAQTGASVQQ